jgi:hypothetical protein
MNIIIDLDLQQAVQGFGSKQPAPTIQVKSQDTPTLSIYFAKGNVNYDLGTSPGLRFGLFVSGNPNPLVQYSAFNRVLDAQSRVTYVGYPNFNTTVMAAAIGSQPQLACIGEIRYQTSFGTIARTADMNFTVLQPRLTETVMDTLIAAFVTPAVNANATARINSTSWLSVGLNISIGAGAGAYQVVSITNLTDFVAKNLGAAGNAASGTTIPIGTSVGIAPVNVLAAYPDPSIIEVTTHKDVINGYAGLDGTGLLKGTEMPVDGKTIIVSGGKLASSAILTTTAANFTTPVANGTVSVTLVSTSGLVAGQYVRIPIAGYYVVTSITDSTHAVLTNNGDPFNAGSGVTITSGAVLMPAQAAAGGGGGSGSPGQNAYTQTTASFTVPAVNATVTVTVGNTAWMGGSGYLLFISGAGYYSVSSITDAAHVVLTNVGGATNAAAGTVVSSGSSVAPSGPAGSTGPSGSALSAYDTLASPFTMPAAAANVTISIANTAWLAVGQVIYIASAGYFQVASISSATQASVTNLNYPGNASSGGTIASGSKVSAGGLIGATGSGGAGKNAFTNLAANFTQPAVNSTVSINVGTTAWMAAGQVIFVQGGGYYSVASITDLTDAVVTNLGYAGNATPGATVTSGSTVAVTPGGLAGTGRDSFTTTTASFTQPAVGSSVTVLFASTAWMAQNQYVFISGGGTYSVASVLNATQAVLSSVAATGNVSSGTSVPSGSAVSPSGPAGPVGAAGPQGPAGSGGGFTPNHTQAVRTSNWTYADATVIPWTGVGWDTDTKWASGTPSRLTVVTAGYYLVTVQLSWSGAGGSTTYLNVNVTVNGSTHPRLGNMVVIIASSFSPTNQLISGILKLNAGDYVEVIPWNQSGTVPSQLTYEAASGSAPVSPIFQLDYIGT